VIIIIPVVLFAGLAIYYLTEFWQWIKIRGEEAEARERRDAQAGELENAEDAVALFASLREVESSNDRSRA
jgi:hypothetical protein